MEIRLYDTLTRRKVALDPVEPGRASMYVCGPTVYDRAHIGNARPAVVFDVLFRLLRHTYGEANVTYVRNVTDVDDKINARARASGRPIGEITAETTRWYHEDMAALGVLRPTVEPRATEHVAEMIAMIALLIERGHAYVAEGHVLFAVASYPGYGRLARRSLEDMRAGARVDVAPYKRDPMDFVLWKPSDPDTPGWDSPWGRGRPGWHIECSAMARRHLGGTFDVHGGGIDLAFPHHENELAQSACAHPDEGFARIWMHNGMLNVEGEKMSKSLGNFFTVRDLLDRGVPGEVIRFVLLSTHYSQPLDWTERRVAEARRTLVRWRAFAGQSEPAPIPDSEFIDALVDDLNTPKAITSLYRLLVMGDRRAFSASAHILGLLTPSLGGWESTEISDLRLNNRIMRAVAARAMAREERNFALADAIRNALVLAGIEVNDKPEGYTQWELKAEFDPTKIENVEALIVREPVFPGTDVRVIPSFMTDDEPNVSTGGGGTK